MDPVLLLLLAAVALAAAAGFAVGWSVQGRTTSAFRYGGACMLCPTGTWHEDRDDCPKWAAFEKSYRR